MFRRAIYREKIISKADRNGENVNHKEKKLFEEKKNQFQSANPNLKYCSQMDQHAKFIRNSNLKQQYCNLIW